MRLYRPGFFAKCLYPDALFRIKTSERLLLLTYDDGPDPESTPELIRILQRYSVKAVFFCSGNKAEQHNELTCDLKNAGHVIGNHGYSHLDGWKTPREEYIADIHRAVPFTSESLFRPPFGHLTPLQYLKLRLKYRIVLWDIMPYEFDKSFGPANAVKIIENKLRPGSVIVLHDSPGLSVNKITEETIISAHGRGFVFADPSVMPGILPHG